MITQGNSLDSYILNYSVKYHFMHHRLYSGYKHWSQNRICYIMITLIYIDLYNYI